MCPINLMLVCVWFLRCLVLNNQFGKSCTLVCKWCVLHPNDDSPSTSPWSSIVLFPSPIFLFLCGSNSTYLHASLCEILFLGFNLLRLPKACRPFDWFSSECGVYAASFVPETTLFIASNFQREKNVFFSEQSVVYTYTSLLPYNTVFLLAAVFVFRVFFFFSLHNKETKILFPSQT